MFSLMASGSTVSTPLVLTAYQQLINGVKWCVFWMTEEDRLGITDGKTQLYEKVLNTSDRMELLGIAESLLAARWRMIFERRGFTVKFDATSDDSVTLSYIKNSVLLTRSDQNTTTNRIAQLLDMSIGQMTQVSKKLVDIELGQQVAALERQTTRRKGMGVAVPAKTRRTRAAPTGLRFDD